MHETHQGCSFDLCPSCGRASYACDRFCRHCGIELTARTQMLANADGATADLPAAAYATAPLASLPERRPVSGPLVRLVTTELPSLNGDGWVRRFTLVLISLPIWLMMILLSPFDAYFATKAVAQRM